MRVAASLRDVKKWAWIENGLIRASDDVILWERVKRAYTAYDICELVVYLVMY